MFEIGQHVIHPGQGVCTVTGFTEDVAHPMILLRAKSGHAETHLMYPPLPSRAASMQSSRARTPKTSSTPTPT